MEWIAIIQAVILVLAAVMVFGLILIIGRSVDDIHSMVNWLLLITFAVWLMAFIAIIFLNTKKEPHDCQTITVNGVDYVQMDCSEDRSES